MNTECLTPKDREVLAAKMGHGKNMQDDYYKDAKVEKVKIRNNKKYVTKHGGHNKIEDSVEKKKARAEAQRKYREKIKLQKAEKEIKEKNN